MRVYDPITKTYDFVNETPYPARRVPYCTCAGYGPHHEPNCGWEIDDSREPRSRRGPAR